MLSWRQDPEDGVDNAIQAAPKKVKSYPTKSYWGEGGFSGIQVSHETTSAGPAYKNLNEKTLSSSFLVLQLRLQAFYPSVLGQCATSASSGTAYYGKEQESVKH